MYINQLKMTELSVETCLAILKSFVVFFKFMHNCKKTKENITWSRMGKKTVQAKGSIDFKW